MPKITIQIEGLNEIIQRMSGFPTKLGETLKKTMEASLLTLWENVPPYPPPPATSTYKRTGMLGRSLGSSETGGKSGSVPQIYEIKQLGSGQLEGGFGTRLGYAPRVIGEGTQENPWAGYWWHMGTIEKKAEGKIIELFEAATETLARWLDGKG